MTRIPFIRALLTLSACGCGRAPNPVAVAVPGPSQSSPFQLALASGWTLESSQKVAANGAQIATAGFADSSWHSATVPITVVAALVADGTYPDPMVGTNLRSLPGSTDYPLYEGFAYYPMMADNPSSVPWWYRTEFDLPASLTGRRVWLRLDGVNYRAEVWLNGRRIADDQTVEGTFRGFELDITAVANVGGKNALAIAVGAPEVENLAWNWVDWAPFPPDKNQGIWQPVSILSTGNVQLRSPHVITAFDLPSLDVAHLQLTVEATNTAEEPIHFQLEASLAAVSSPNGDGATPAPIVITTDVTLAAHETRTLRLDPSQFPELDVAQPRLWWPIDIGPQNLYQLSLRALSLEGELSDQIGSRFGIRQVDSELVSGDPNADDWMHKPKRLFRVNGRPILIRGAGWAPDLLLRNDPARVDDEIAYVKDIHLNALRLEGKLGNEHLFDRADEEGILIIAGWCCCDHWEMPDDWSGEDRRIAVASLDTQIRILRTHPSVMVWLNGSDDAPPEATEQAYVDKLKELDWELPTFASANSTQTPVLGWTGLKMPGPYQWVPPSYWYTDKLEGGAFGFDTETSPGAAIPPVESLRKFLPAADLWPVDDAWLFHAGGSTSTSDLSGYQSALDARYGVSADLEDFTLKSQLAAYDGERAMFEAYARNKYDATGVVQWMLNNPMPGVIWHLYDYYLKPAGGYFGAKKACEPVHVQYGYDNRSISVVNSTPNAFTDLSVTATVFDLHSNAVWTQSVSLDLGDDAVVTPLVLPAQSALGLVDATYFVALTLTDATATILSRNFYWLSQKADQLDDQNRSGWVTPTIGYADLTGLSSLPMVQLDATASRTMEAGQEIVQVRLENAGSSLALFVRAEVAKGDGGDEATPILWDDNYVTLLPGEVRVLTARYRSASLQGAAAAVRMFGWNVAQVPVPLH